MRHFPPLQINLRPSRLLLWIGVSAHLLAVVAVAVSSLGLWIKGGLIVGIVLALAGFGWRYGNGYRMGGDLIVGLELVAEQWRLHTRTGTCHRVEWRGGYAHPLLIILNFRLATGRRWSLTLLPDSASPDPLRRLRVWLRTRPVLDKNQSPDF